MKARTIFLTASLCLASIQSVADEAPAAPITPPITESPPANTPTEPPTSPPRGTVMDSSGPFVATEPVDALPSPEEPIPLTEEMVSLEEWQKVNPELGLYPADVPDPDQNLGEPDGQSCAGNPINIATGNKFQEEVDIPKRNNNSLELVRYYNSQRAVHWSHTYSVYVKKEGAYVGVKTAEGATLKFSNQPGNYVSLNAHNNGTLQRIGNGWEYKNIDKDTFRFDENGRLIQWLGHTGYAYDVVYSGNAVTITDIYQKKISLSHDSYGRLSSAKNEFVEASYQYDKGGRLIGTTYNFRGKMKSRAYRYEDPRLPFHLTSIIDERGVTFALWSYDARGRATSSMHAGGVDKTTLTYETPGETVVTNALGKQSTHVYQVINNVKRLARIDGEASQNCPMSNSKFKYDTNGRLIEKTAENGIKTVYTYNPQGFEISRTEAMGTPIARTVTTHRDSNGVRPVKIIEPGKQTTLRHDESGRVIEISVE